MSGDPTLFLFVVRARLRFLFSEATPAADPTFAASSWEQIGTEILFHGSGGRVTAVLVGENADQASSTETTRKSSGKGERSVEFLVDRFVVSIFFGTALLTAIQFRAEPRIAIAARTSSNQQLTSAGSGFKLDLEIAFSGSSNEGQRSRASQLGRRCAETSGDVIRENSLG
jgi:hypothetical protein